MRLVRLLLERVRDLAPEALRFGAVGLANTVLYFLIFNVTMGIGAVKATVIATIVTTTLSYLANRHWTYKHRPKTALRREYTLFFAFNLAGMVIQSGVVGIGKYGMGLNESQDRIAFNIATCLGISLATLFRFWTYRTMVFKPVGVDTAAPADVAVPADGASVPVTTAPPTGVPANGSDPAIVVVPAARQPRAADQDHLPEQLVGLNDPLDVELEAELAAADLNRAGRPAAG